MKKTNSTFNSDEFLQQEGFDEHKIKKCLNPMLKCTECSYNENCELVGNKLNTGRERDWLDEVA